jgi:HEPN domain-containing protein
MTQKRLPPDDAREWLTRARSNLAHAQQLGGDVLLEDLCYDAQQAAEKAIKALYVHRGERFPFIHELDELLDLLGRSGVKVPKYVREAEELSQYAVETRYPGLAGPVSRREYRRAVRIATAVLRWAERQVAASRAGPGKKK